MKNLFALLLLTFLAAGCSAKVVDTFKGSDATVSVLNQKCKDKKILDMAIDSGAAQEQAAAMKAAKIKVHSGGPQIKACVFYASPDAVIVVDENGNMGILRKQGKGSIEDGPATGKQKADGGVRG